MKGQKIHKAQQLILKVDQMHKQLYNRWGHKVGAHRSQHMVLMYLSRFGVTASQKEIADTFEISPPAVAMLLKRLEKNGYVIREPLPSDNRCNVIQLTKKGKNIVEKTEMLGEECNRAAFKNFSESELDAFISLTEKLQINLKQFLDNMEEEVDS